LTGRPPFKAATALETLWQLQTREPVPPGRLQPGLPRDLQTICLKCLEKEPERRYASATALAEDLESWCAGRPIRARRARPLERLLKWARRRPALAVLASVCVLLLAGLLGGAAVYERQLRAALRDTATQKERAIANYREARAALRKILERASARGSSDIPRVRELQREQEEDALAFFLKIAEQQGDDPEVRVDAALACHEVGILQTKLGRKEEALANLHRAREALTALAAELPHHPRYRYELTRVLLTLIASKLLPPGHAGPYLEQALAQVDQLLAEEPEHLDYRAAKATIHMHLGTWQRAEQDDEADAHLVQAATLFEQLSQAQPRERKYRLMLANALANLSPLRQKQKRDPREAHDRAEAILEQMYREQPEDDDVLGSLTALRVNWAYMQHAQGRSDEALQALAKNVKQLQAALRTEPSHETFRDRLLRSHGVRSEILYQQQRFAESAQERRHVIELMDDVAAADYQRLFLAMSEARANRPADAARVLDDWTTRIPATAPTDQLVFAAGVYCRILDGLPKAQEMTAAERDALTEGCGKQAVALLVRLEERGFFRDAARARELAIDRDYQPLRGRADFAQLLMRVNKRTK
jgi:tetratricopeptide (TPR) repeat protein